MPPLQNRDEKPIGAGACRAQTQIRSGGGTATGQRFRPNIGHGEESKTGVAFKEPGYLLFIFFFKQRTGGIDEPAADLGHPVGGGKNAPLLFNEACYLIAA